MQMVISNSEKWLKVALGPYDAHHTSKPTL